MFRTAIPVLKVANWVAAERFYCEGLGFKVMSAWRPDETKSDPCYATLTRDEARLHIHSFQSGASGTSAMYVFVDDVTALYAELVSKGVSVSGPPIDQTWGMREIGVSDPDKNLVTFGQRIAPPA
jgi:uncharacterized glyoxalase superfamily protein PhnB